MYVRKQRRMSQWDVSAEHDGAGIEVVGVVIRAKIYQYRGENLLLRLFEEHSEIGHKYFHFQGFDARIFSLRGPK